MKGTNEDFVKGRFTKYLETAVDRSRRDYIKKEQARTWREAAGETEIPAYWPEESEIGSVGHSLETMEEVSWEPERIRQRLKECLDIRMWKSVAVLTDLELVVVYGKVFRQLTFAEIGSLVEQKPEKIADTYSYARKKMRKGWKKNGN